MNDVPRRHNLGKLMVGLTILAFGVIFTLSNLGVIESGNYLRYWPVILIAFGLGKLLSPRESGGKMFGFIVGAVGALLLLKEFGKITWSIWALWPMLLVLLGLSIIWGAFGFRPRRNRPWRRHGVSVAFNGQTPHRQIDPDSTLDVNSVFGGNERLVTSQDFRGGTISTIMGGCEVDFRQASIAQEEAVLDLSVVFGGVELRVPEDWKVVLKVNAFLGGVEDRTRKPVGDIAKKLIVTGSVVFGGIEVRN